jgi:Family of unknown function (DUF6636)
MRRTLVLCVVIISATVWVSSSSALARWFRSPSRNIECEVGLSRPGLGTYAFCLSKQPVRCAKLKPDGKVVTYQNCLLDGNGSDTPFTLHYGHSLRVGPFRCTSRRIGMQCVAVRSGHGFVISREGLKRF